MGKVSSANKMRTQTLREQGYITHNGRTPTELLEAQNSED